MELREVGEFGLIERVKKKVPPYPTNVIKGIGDDGAISSLSAGLSLVSTVDLLVEGIHFDLSFTSAFLLGRKVLAVNLSDLAAMGAKPLFALISLALPGHLKVEFVDEFISGFLEIAQENKVALIGGDTSSSIDRLFVSVTLLGEGAKEKLLCRQGAQVGDDLYVTGTLGDALEGLKILQKKKDSLSPAEAYLVERHLNPSPRLKEGAILAEKNLARAMIDISDGLLSDLEHICTESKVGATIQVEKIPLSAPLRQICKERDEPAWKSGLRGGEDYELLFTAPPEKAVQIEKLGREWQCGITRLGKIEPAGHGVVVKDAQGPIDVSQLKGYDHFLRNF